MATITPFPTPDQRQVLRELDGLAASRNLSAQQRQRIKSRFLATVNEGRSTAVAVAEARRPLNGRPEHASGTAA